MQADLSSCTDCGRTVKISLAWLVLSDFPSVIKWHLIGSLSNDVSDVNENGKKAIGLDWQKNSFARASRFFVDFFALTTRLQRENT